MTDSKNGLNERACGNDGNSLIQGGAQPDDQRCGKQGVGKPNGALQNTPEKKDCRHSSNMKRIGLKQQFWAPNAGYSPMMILEQWPRLKSYTALFLTVDHHGVGLMCQKTKRGRFSGTSSSYHRLRGLLHPVAFFVTCLSTSSPLSVPYSTPCREST